MKRRVMEIYDPPFSLFWNLGILDLPTILEVPNFNSYNSELFLNWRDSKERWVGRGEEKNIKKMIKVEKPWNGMFNEILTKKIEKLFQCFLYFFVASILRGMKKAKGI